MEVIKNRIYRHFKGDYVIIEDIATHSETKEQYVVYRELHSESQLWVRPLDMFQEKVDKEKYPDIEQEYRFELQNIKSVREK